MALPLLCWSGVVQAKDFADTVDDAAALLKSGDTKAAIDLLESIEEQALRSDEVISGDQLAKARPHV